MIGAMGTGIPSASKVFFLSPHAGTDGGAVEISGFDDAVVVIKIMKVKIEKMIRENKMVYEW